MKRKLTLLALLLFGPLWDGSGEALAAASHRLGPGAERSVGRCIGLEQPKLTEAVELSGLHVERDHVRLILSDGSTSWTVSLYAPDDPKEAARRTAGGALVTVDPIPGAALDTLAARLEACGPKIPFIREVDPIDAERRAREVRTLTERLSERLGRGNARPTSEEDLREDLQAILGDVRAGRDETALAALQPMLQGLNPPRGGLSLWLAAGGGAEVCLDGQRCVAGEVITDLIDGHLHGEWTARWGHEPRLLLRAAERSAALADHARARAFLLAALVSDLPDQAVIDRAVEWGWGSGSTVNGLPGRPDAGSTRTGDAGDALFLLLAMVLFGAAWWTAREERPLAAVASLGVVGGLVLALWMPGQDRGGATPTLEMPTSVQMEWGRGAGCELGWPTVMDGALYVPMSCDGERLGAMARVEGEELRISVMPRAGGAPLGPGAERWKRTIERSRESGLMELLSRVESREPGLGDLEARLARLEAHQVRAIHSTGPVAALALMALLALLIMGLRSMFAWTATQRGDRRLLLGASLIGVLSHVAAPAAMVMVYGGYGQVSELVAWQPLRYGAGANWLYGPWLELFGYDHGVIQAANRVYGLVTLVFLSAWAERLVSRSGGLVAALLALSPILWRDHASESILVGGMMMLSAGLWGISCARAGRVGAALLALPCLCLAAMTRPEFALFSIPLVVITAAQRRDAVRQLRRHDWLGLALGVIAALLLAPSVFSYLEASTRWMIQTGALPGLESLSSRLVGDAVNPVRAFLDLAEWTPWVTFPLALLTLAWKGSRGLGAGVLLVSLAWMAFTRVDLPAVSIPRVHAPVCALLVVLAGAGLSGLIARWTERFEGRGARIGGWLVATALWCLQAPVVAGALYAPTNADAEELLVRDAQREIAGSDVCLVTLDSRDSPPRGKTPRVWPSYLFTGREEPVRILGLGELEGALTVCRGDTYALLGVRCYMALRDEHADAPPPPGSPLLESCAQFKSRWPLETVIERDIQNQGDVAYPMYPAGERLTIGLYRVLTGGEADGPDTERHRSRPR